MASILVKTYIRQLFGSPDIHLFEFDSQTAGIDELRKAVSQLVGGRAVTLTWMDRDGDEIRLSTDEQLAFAVKHGVKENVLRVTVRVDWLGVEAGRQRRQRAQQSQQDAVETDVLDGEQSATAADDAGEDPETEATAEDGEDESNTTSSGAASAKTKKPTKRSGGKSSGNACYSGFVRTVGADGVARERDLTEEEAAYLLHNSSPLSDFTRSPFSLCGSLFSAPQLQYRHRPANTPYFLAW